MDNLLISTNSTAETVELRRRIEGSLSKGEFELAKWTSNEPAVVQSTEEQTRVCLDDPDVSILGLLWHTRDDCLGFKVKLEDPKLKITKRVVASEGARIFDPNVSPVIIKARMFMQNIWKIGIDWDEEVPVEIADAWVTYYNELEGLKDIKIPRWLGMFPGVPVQLHTFYDASQRTYGAVIYVGRKLITTNSRCSY